MLISENFLLYTPFFLVLWEQISHPEKKNKTCVCDKGLDVIYQVCCDFSILWKVPVTKWMNACVSYCCSCRAGSGCPDISSTSGYLFVSSSQAPLCRKSVIVMMERVVLWHCALIICWVHLLMWKDSIQREHIRWCKGKHLKGAYSLMQREAINRYSSFSCKA